MNLINKKKILLLGSIGFAIHLISRFSVDLGICENYSTSCFDKISIFRVYSFIFVPFLLFSIITFKLNDKTYSIWVNFSKWFIPLSLLIVSAFPNFTHGMDFVPITKGVISLFLVVFYSAVSLVIILYKTIIND